MKRFYRWCIRAWPLWAALLVVGTHQGFLTAFPSKSDGINESFVIGLQVVGGLLVLHSIDSTLGILRGESIPRVIAQWFRACPIWSKPRIVEGLTKATLSITASAHGRVKRQATSLPDRVAELERQMDEVYREVERRDQSLQKLVSEAKDELSARAGKHEAALRGVEGIMDVTALGSIKQQAFGVIIALYGAGLGHFS